MEIHSFLVKISQMTIYNPLFAIVFITVLWFLPGIFLRNLAKKRYISKKIKAQQDKISKLYPKEK